MASTAPTAPPSARIPEIKARLVLLNAHRASLLAQSLAAQAEAARLKQASADADAAIAAMLAELDAAAHTPVARGEDPTLWLPDELVLQILLHMLSNTPLRHLPSLSALAHALQRPPDQGL